MIKLMLLVLVTLSTVQFSRQGVQDNEVVDDKMNAFAEVAQAMMSDKNGDIGGMISGFMASEGGKQLGDMLTSGNGAGAANLIQGLGSLLGQAGNSPGGGGGGLDFEMLANVVSAFSGMADSGKERSGTEEGFDLSSAVNLAKSFMGQDGAKDMMGYLPTLLNVFNTLNSPETAETAKEHEGHAWILPPVLEKLHVFLDQLFNSDVGADLIRKAGAENIVKLFHDDKGKFSYGKFVDLMENHSFRRHWIQQVTSKIVELLNYVADPYTQKKTLATVQFFLNNFLKSQGIPKQALFDPIRPGESLTALVNYLPKRYLGIKFNSAPYVIPAVNYLQDLMRLAENKGIIGRAWNTNELTDKLTDTINLEMIEPLARVNRAIRFAKRMPTCVRYVLCVANRHEPDETLSLPGLKKALANAATFGASWLLSNYDNTPFWTLYGTVQGGKNCENYHRTECHDFHIEEEKVTTEYVHNEL